MFLSLDRDFDFDFDCVGAKADVTSHAQWQRRQFVLHKVQACGATRMDRSPVVSSPAWEDRTDTHARRHWPRPGQEKTCMGTPA
jgi:hypothetical protein